MNTGKKQSRSPLPTILQKYLENIFNINKNKVHDIASIHCSNIGTDLTAIFCQHGAATLLPFVKWSLYQQTTMEDIVSFSTGIPPYDTAFMELSSQISTSGGTRVMSKPLEVL